MVGLPTEFSTQSEYVFERDREYTPKVVSEGAGGRAWLANIDAAGDDARPRRRARYRRSLRPDVFAEAGAAMIPPVEDGVAWQDELLGRLGVMPPAAFERLCQQLLRAAGFTRVEVTGKSGDGGVDGTGVLRMNLLSFQVVFQCKRWAAPVGSSVIRDFRGAMIGRADKGLIITTGAFTGDARREATRDGAPAIDLVDGEALCVLLKEHRLGVRVEMVERVTIDDRALVGL